MAAHIPLVKQGFARFFASVQEAPWYAHFLNLALEELGTLSVGSKVLDVGTGPGKFIEFAQDSFDLRCVGVDIDEAMLAQARKRPSLAKVPLIKTKPQQALPFEDEMFDAVCFCSVLFLMDHPKDLLNEALRLLRSGGKIIVLTPAGNGSLRDGLNYFSTHGLTAQSGSFIVWKNATTKKAVEWERGKILFKYAEENHVLYKKHYGFRGFAVVETLQKINEYHMHNQELWIHH